MSAVLAKLNVAHDGMMDYILQNPGATLREISGYFGYTIPWVCQVVNSDIFQSRLAERRQEVEGLIARDIPAKLRAAADLSIERIIDKIGTSEDPDFLLDAFDKVMHRAGYAPKAHGGSGPGGAGVANQQNNFFYLTKEDLAQMRPGLSAERVVEQVGISYPEPAPQQLEAPDR